MHAKKHILAEQADLSTALEMTGGVRLVEMTGGAWLGWQEMGLGGDDGNELG